jgi:hypothetical protein
MSMKRVLILDVRQQHELASHRYSAQKLNKEGAKTNTKYDLMNIPAENIKYNQGFLRDLFSEYDEVWITCQLNNRASYIKRTYFADMPQVITNPTGHFGFPGFDSQEHVTERNSGHHTSTVYILQMAFGLILLIIALVLYMNMAKPKQITWIIYALIIMGCWIMLEGYFKFCPGVKYLNRMYW